LRLRGGAEGQKVLKSVQYVDPNVAVSLIDDLGGLNEAETITGS